MYPFRSSSVALLHEAHSSLDACAGCGRGQWSGGAQPSLSSSTAAADALEAVVRADLVMLFTCLVVVDWQVRGGSSTCTLHEHAQMMLYRTQITSAIIRTCGSATGMVFL